MPVCPITLGAEDKNNKKKKMSRISKQNYPIPPGESPDVGFDRYPSPEDDDADVPRDIRPINNGVDKTKEVDYKKATQNIPTYRQLVQSRGDGTLVEVPMDYSI